jgi:pSer/pThr/pTyr-binding forkhead associated (FHA) protein
MIEGFFDANTSFRRYCAVDSKHIDIIFGRGDVDISIEHPAISRAHARLLGNTESMTFSDLGSSNGVFINGIPCLPGEIMFVETGDEVFLGQLKIRIAVASTQAELT